MDTLPGPRTLFRSVRGKLTCFVAALVALTTVALTLAGYGFVRDMLRDNVREQLSLHGAGLREVLLSYVAQQQERVSLVASRTRLRQLLRERLDGEIGLEPFIAQTRRILLDAQRSTGGFLRIRIADLEGRVLTATDDASLALDVSRDPDFLAGRSAPTLGLPHPVDGRHRAVLSAPAHTNDARELGVIMVLLDVDPLLGLLGALRSGYQTAEIRLAARAGERIRYLFPIGPDRSTLEVDAAADPAMANALEGGTGFLDAHAYRGRHVLAVYRATGYRDWALVAQVDAAEAYAPIDRLGGLALLTGLVVFAIAALGAFQLATRFTRPILSLSRSANAIEGGDLEVRAQAKSHDELGELCHAFNHMAEGLKRHRDHLQELVRARTMDLEERTAQLKRSRDQLEGLVGLLEEQAEVIQRDLHRAEIIQRSLLPHAPPSLPDFTVQTLYRPGRNVGGDLYDVVGIGDRYVVLVIADASGHGVSAAMLAVLFKHRLRVIDEASGRPYTPGEALRGINASLRQNISAPGVFVTAAYCLLDVEQCELTVSSAGHPPLLWLKAGGETSTIPPTGPALGLYAEATFAERRCRLGRGDQLLLYTDGLLDTDREQPPDTDRIADTLRSLAGEPTPLPKLFAEFARGVAWEDRDDATIVLLEARPGKSSFDEPGESERIAPVSSSPLEMAYAELDDATLIAVRGRATWTHAETFFGAADAVIEEKRPLVVDFSACEYLDSTFLGTLFQIVSQAEAASASVRIQGVLPVVRTSLEELSMHTVLAHVSERAVALPVEMAPLAIAKGGATHHQLRLLRAHELLSRLSESNREEFHTVVEMLRSELGRP